MLTSFAKVEVVYKNGNKVSFENESGVELSCVKAVSNILKEEIKVHAPEKKAA